MQQQRLSAMAQDISALNLKYALNPVSTFSSVPSDFGEHTTALETEISRMASTMPNPVYRSLFKLGMNNALQETLRGLGCISSDQETEPTDLHLRRGRERNDSIVGHTFPKNSSWLVRNVRRKHFVLKNFFGTFYVRSRTNTLESSLRVNHPKYGDNIKYEQVTSFCACPAPWLVQLGMNYGFKVGFHTSTIWGWKHALNTFRVVPDDAMIFEFCKDGNSFGVQTILSRGEASVRDTDSHGRTALFVSDSKNFLLLHQSTFTYKHDV